MKNQEIEKKDTKQVVISTVWWKVLMSVKKDTQTSLRGLIEDALAQVYSPNFELKEKSENVAKNNI